VGEVRDGDYLLSRVGPVADGSETGRLDELNQVGRHRHSNFVAASP
jgi:hypothetical protein